MTITRRPNAAKRTGAELANEPSERGQAERRLQMVNGQLRASDVTDLAVLAAFRDTAREQFVQPRLIEFAYLDQSVASAGSSTRKLLAPRTIARLLQAAAVAPGDRALDVGGGAGYTSALLAALGARVVTLESDAGAVAAARENLKGLDIDVVEGALADGAAAKGPYSVIVLNGGFEETPTTLLGQLAEGGRLVGIDCRSGSASACVIERIGSGFSERSLFETVAPTLEGLAKAPSFAF